LLVIPESAPTQLVILSEARSAESKDPDAIDIPSAARTILPTEPVRVILKLRISVFVVGCVGTRCDAELKYTLADKAICISLLGVRRVCMQVYYLNRESLPRVKRGQQTIIVQCLQPVGTRKTLSQLANDCLSQNYAVRFKRIHVGKDLTEFTMRSILYHFHQTPLGSLIGTYVTAD
jgi:hypothetical protein